MPRALLLATLATASALRVTRRALPAAAALGVPAAAQAKPPGGTASRTEGYEVQKSEAEWQRQLSSVEYFVLRNGGTEPPNSSPLVKEKRPGEFRCAGCGVPLFSSAAKFDSGTGWPSFATQLPAVAVESSALEFLAGAEIRCGRCGGHLGDRFLDGALFPGVGGVVSGLPDEDELDDAYRAARGDDGGTAAGTTWFRALGRLKMAAIMGHNLRRHREGRHHDPVQEQLPPTIRALIGSAAALLDRSPS